MTDSKNGWSMAAEDAGALPIQCDVTRTETGMAIAIHPCAGTITNEAGEVISTFSLQPDTIVDEVRAGGRIFSSFQSK